MFIKKKKKKLKVNETNNDILVDLQLDLLTTSGRLYPATPVNPVLARGLAFLSPPSPQLPPSTHTTIYDAIIIKKLRQKSLHTLAFNNVTVYVPIGSKNQ